MDDKAREAFQWAVDNYANPEINHVDYRVKMVHLAEAALAHAQRPQPTHAEMVKIMKQQMGYTISGKPVVALVPTPDCQDGGAK